MRLLPLLIDHNISHGANSGCTLAAFEVQMPPIFTRSFFESSITPSRLFNICTNASAIAPERESYVRGLTKKLENENLLIIPVPTALITIFSPEFSPGLIILKKSAGRQIDPKTTSYFNHSLGGIADSLMRTCNSSSEAIPVRKASSISRLRSSVFFPFPPLPEHTCFFLLARTMSRSCLINFADSSFSLSIFLMSSIKCWNLRLLAESGMLFISIQSVLLVSCWLRLLLMLEVVCCSFCLDSTSRPSISPKIWSTKQGKAWITRPLSTVKSWLDFKWC